jgi:hypothetical protein
MKTSELIKRLQYLQKDIPFDAEIVTGDDWQPSELVRVFHEPPHTFLEFESIGSSECIKEMDSFSDTQILIVRAYVSSLLHATLNKEASINEAEDDLLSFITFCQRNSPLTVIELLKALNAEASN